MKSLKSEMKLLVESIILTEGYEDRVRQAAQYVANIYGDGEKIKKVDIVPSLKREREQYMSNKAAGKPNYSGLKDIMPELGLSDLTWRQAAKDIITAISAGGYIKRAGPATPRAPYSVLPLHAYYGDKRIGVTHDEISELGFKLMGWAGESFPDGDPNDRVMQWMERKGWDVSDAYERIMPIACKKSLGTKDYSEYLAQLWDDVYADTKRDADDSGLGYSDDRPSAHMGGSDHLLHSMGGEKAENPWRSRR